VRSAPRRSLGQLPGQVAHAVDEVELLGDARGVTRSWLRSATVLTMTTMLVRMNSRSRIGSHVHAASRSCARKGHALFGGHRPWNGFGGGALVGTSDAGEGPQARF
jgi:hypothetical protein